MPTPVNGEITAIEQTDGNHFFIGTGSGLFHTGIEKGKLNIMPNKVVEGIGTSVHELYYHAVSKQLFVGNYKEGILIYDVGKTGKIIPCQSPNNVEINRIVALNAHELLVATGGKGVYKLDMNTCMSEPYITADYNSYNGMNGNNINDIYVDEEERIWLANYPTGITIRNNRYGSYDLIRHSLGNSLSLVNDQVMMYWRTVTVTSGLRPVTVSVFIRPTQKNGAHSSVPLIRYRMMRITSFWHCVKPLPE